MNLAVGQRWTYDRVEADIGYDDSWICEITQTISDHEASIKIVQIIRGRHFNVGTTYGRENMSRSVYSLLEGQEAPK